MALLKIENLSCAYGNKTILKDCSLNVEAGQIVGILGANGCGKTTLLKCICQTIPYSGNIILEDALEAKNTASLSAKELAKHISYIPQTSGISIDLSVLEVVLMGLNPELDLFEKPSKAHKEKALEILNKLGIADFAETNYMELSQGQKQLVLLARTLITNSKILLMDEPESALDFGNRYELINQVRKHIGTDKTALITLHDPQLALNCCDTINVICDKKCIASFNPASCSEEEIEAILTKIYGPININTCYTHSNKKQFVVLAED